MTTATTAATAAQGSTRHRLTTPACQSGENRSIAGLRVCRIIPMTSSDLWDEATARRYDETASSMFDPDVLDPVVEVPAGLAGSGRALELAIGTGRVAVPLSARGVPVCGIELSEPMVEQLRRKADASTIPVVVGDM